MDPILSSKDCKLDFEWVLLMKEAKENGMEPSEVKIFLDQIKQEK
ncbi:DNA-binding anti-repressor SinI [Alkalihalobacterium chitinilyticum]|uniref:Anti-repressor SinI family protein n=1 Tax=Alkalihalobacterium chitinilyticum TaxID=2980103 RepID=A0ABT5VET3_9BACI|nr:DNA-binding anti-repressor SinI [Alkalihalobacterium chitinilyticum]MDE5413775.1 anti-repressor SinI family protein [Alkalihalobacterium chitinilyticum]